jgi:imidazolonepropionase-like amidohydrolase
MSRWMALISACLFAVAPAAGQIAVRGERVHTSAGPVIEDGVVLMGDGRITAVGPASEIDIPPGFEVLSAAVVTPGLIDAHTVVGLSGFLNQPHDQDQLEASAPIQPHLRAIDAYNPDERLVEWVRSFGVTTLHTGHGPGSLISGQTMIVKTVGRTVEEALVRPVAAVAATLGPSAREQGKAPGTRSKAAAMLRAELVKAGEYQRKLEAAKEGSEPARDLARETLVGVLLKEIPLLVTVHRANDILTALRVAREFDINLILDGVAEAHLVLDEIRESGFPVIVHPPMQRSFGELENLSMETPAKLWEAGIRFAFQSGFESYVPKTRVLLFEAAVGARYGLTFEDTLAAATIEAARILGIDDRVGSLEVGKDADLVLFDGDPFEYTTHVVGVLVNGRHASRGDAEWR